MPNTNQTQITTNVTLTGPGSKATDSVSYNFYPSSTLYTDSPQLIPTNYVLLSASIGPYDVLTFRNTDFTSSITIAANISGTFIYSVIPPNSGSTNGGNSFTKPRVVLQGVSGSFYALSSPSSSYISILGSPP